MKNHEKYNIQSEILKNHWDIIGDTYVKAKEKYEECFLENNDDEDYWKYGKVFELLIEEWKIIYPKFVLFPLENKILDLFYTIQTKGFENEKNIKEEINKFTVFYYLTQYLYIFVIPSNRNNFSYEEQPRFEIKTDDPNLLLREIFEEIWDEINLKDDEEFGTFDELDLGEFYNIEFNSLNVFLSKCWNNTKAKTNTKVIAILSESTGAGESYFLDENRILSDEELIKILNEN